MKKILPIIFTLIALNSFSQYVEPQHTQNNNAIRGWQGHTPGTELRKAGNSFFTGLALETGGIIFVSVGSSLMSYNANTGGATNTSAGQADVTIGGLMIVAGFTYNILAWLHVNRAGRLMDMNNKASFNGTKNGVGLTYNF